jgi:hypothetical protein
MVEILACITIVAVVSAVVFPVVVRAKRRGWVSADLAHLRQLGQYRELYVTDTGADCWDARQLAISYNSVSPLLESQLDPIPEGIGNQIARAIHDRLPFLSPWHVSRMSFVSYATFGRSQSSWNELKEMPNAGWLCSFDEVTPSETSGYLAPVGSYLRLHLDGSVHRHNTQLFDGNQVGSAGGLHLADALYCDPSPDDLKVLLK